MDWKEQIESAKQSRLRKYLWEDEEDLSGKIKELPGQVVSRRSTKKLESYMNAQRFSAMKTEFQGVFGEVLERHRHELMTPQNQLIQSIKQSLVQLDDLHRCLRATNSVPEAETRPSHASFNSIFTPRAQDHPCFWEYENFVTTVSLYKMNFSPPSYESEQRFNHANQYLDCLEQQNLIDQGSQKNPAFRQLNADCDAEKKRAQAGLSRADLHYLPDFTAGVFRDFHWEIYHQEYLPCQKLKAQIGKEILKYGLDSTSQDKLFDCQVRLVCPQEIHAVENCAVSQGTPYQCRSEIEALFECGISKVLIKQFSDISKLAKVPSL